MRVVEDSAASTVSVVKEQKSKPTAGGQGNRRGKECWNCGRKHDFQKRESCPAYGKTCTRCHKLNHFAVKCRSKPPPPRCSQSRRKQMGKTPMRYFRRLDQQLRWTTLSWLHCDSTPEATYGFKLTPGLSVMWCHWGSTKKPPGIKR